jgi:hypothetical protein
MKPVAYISPNGILYKELPPDSMLELTPLYAMHKLTNEEISNIRDEYLSPKHCDIYSFARAILKKASGG